MPVSYKIKDSSAGILFDRLKAYISGSHSLVREFFIRLGNLKTVRILTYSPGTAGILAQKFKGISLAEEKDLVLILSARPNRDPIMRSIMDKAGIDTPAHAIVFTLPVESIAGLRSAMPEEDQAEEEA